MPIIITNAKSSLDELAARLLTSRASEAQRAAAVQALKVANPGLTGVVAKGAAVVLPELAHRRVKVDAGALLAGDRLSDVEAVVAPLPAVVESLSSRAKSRQTRVLGDLKKASKMTEDPQVKRFLTKSRASAAADRAKADAEASAALAKALADAVPRWSEDLAKLKALLLRTG